MAPRGKDQEIRGDCLNRSFQCVTLFLSVSNLFLGPILFQEARLFILTSKTSAASPFPFYINQTCELEACKASSGMDIAKSARTTNKMIKSSVVFSCDTVQASVAWKMAGSLLPSPLERFNDPMNEHRRFLLANQQHSLAAAGS